MWPVISHFMVTLNIWISHLCERKIIWSFCCDTCGQIWILWCCQHQFDDLRWTSWPTGQAVPVQRYSGLMFHVVYLVFYLTFSKFWVFWASWSLLLHFIWPYSEILGKVNQIKFCANVQMDQFTFHESAVIRQSPYEYEFWIILWAATSSIFPGVPCAL